MATGSTGTTKGTKAGTKTSPAKQRTETLAQMRARIAASGNPF